MGKYIVAGFVVGMLYDWFLCLSYMGKKFKTRTAQTVCKFYNKVD